jgi:glucose uptake protein
VWGLGTLANLVSGEEIGFALSYAVGQSAPLVAILWGVLYYKEFRGCPRKAAYYLATSVFFYVAAIAVLAFSSDI